jgi:quercetin dioxygenase-like cupin family protein
VEALERYTWRRATGALLAIGGLCAIGIATWGLTHGGATSGAAPVATGGPAAPATSVPPSSHVDTEFVTYQPGQTSSWHAHMGVHAVAILSGEITIIDDNCQRHVYQAGDTYVGGRDPHAARNETGVATIMVVTYVFDPGAGRDNFLIQVAAPAGCAGLGSPA